MALEKTYEELLASKINPRNYSSVLPIIYNLRKRAIKDYMPFAPVRTIYTAAAVGYGSSAIFDAISPPSYAKGSEITLSGTATYVLSGGGVNIIQPAIEVIAQIDVGRDSTSFPAFQVRATVSEISSGGVGVFSFKIPSSITQNLSSGLHYVYIDASSPDNPPTRLVASGMQNDTRTFTIT